MTPHASTPRRCRAGARTRGTSLVETLLASLILVVVAVPIFAMLEGSSRIFARGDAAAGLHNELRSTADRMVRELRMTGYDPSASGVAAFFEVAGATTVRFIADVDNDGTTERTEYAYDAAARTITREFWQWAGAAWGPGSGPLVVARNVDSLTLAYFDATDAPPAGLADIRRVTVTLAGSHLHRRADGQFVAGHDIERYTVSSEARARNLL